MEGFTPDDMNSLNNFYKLGTYFACVAGVIVYLQLLKDRRYWDMMEMAQGAIYFLLVPFSDMVLEGWIEGDADAVSSFFFRLVLLSNGAAVAMLFLTKNSTDPTVPMANTISFILTRGVVLLSTMNAAWLTNVYKKSMLTFDLVYLALLLIGNLAHLRKVSRNDGRMHLRASHTPYVADALITFFLGSCLLGFPDMFIKFIVPKIVVDDVHMTLAASFGAMLLGGSVLSFSALCFKRREDVSAVLKSKLVLYIPMAGVSAIAYLNYATFQNCGHIGLMMILPGILILNALRVIFSNEDEGRED